MSLVSKRTVLVARIAEELNKKADKQDIAALQENAFMIHKTDSFMKQQTEFIKNINNNWE